MASAKARCRTHAGVPEPDSSPLAMRRAKEVRTATVLAAPFSTRTSRTWVAKDAAQSREGEAGRGADGGSQIDRQGHLSDAGELLKREVSPSTDEDGFKNWGEK